MKPQRRVGRGGERGSASVALLASSVVLAGAIGASLGAAAGALRAAARVEGAADLVAAAAVVGGADAARTVADRNAVSLEHLTGSDGGVVTVDVRGGSRTARSAARPAGADDGPGSWSDLGRSLGSPR